MSTGPYYVTYFLEPEDVRPRRRGPFDSYQEARALAAMVSETFRLKGRTTALKIQIHHPPIVETFQEDPE